MDGVEQTDNGYVFLWLTATPIPATSTLAPIEPTPRLPATTSPSSTETTVPASEAVPTSTPASRKNFDLRVCLVHPVGFDRGCRKKAQTFWSIAAGNPLL